MNSLRFGFAFAFVNLMLGMHKPQQQATLTKLKIPEIFFRFRFAEIQASSLQHFPYPLLEEGGDRTSLGTNSILGVVLALSLANPRPPT